MRAYKHILQAVIAAVHNVDDLASSVASCLNVLLGTSSAENGNENSVNDEKLKWNWVENFLRKRFGWNWKHDSGEELRKYAILRGLCHKVCSYCFQLSLYEKLLLIIIKLKNKYTLSGWT